VSDKLHSDKASILHAVKLSFETCLGLETDFPSLGLESSGLGLDLGPLGSQIIQNNSKIIQIQNSYELFE